MKVGIYHTWGDGGHQGSLEVLVGAAEAGAKLLEVGLPFSDPLLDGPVIQASHTRACKFAGLNWEEVCQGLTELKKNIPTDVQISVMTSAQLIYTQARRMLLPEVDGLLVTDIDALKACPFPLPSPRVWFLSQEVALATADLLPPENVGMVYLTRLQGVTGAGQQAAPQTAAAIEKIKKTTKAPLWLGFGISSREDVQEAHRCGADGAVIGSAFVKALQEDLEQWDEKAKRSGSPGILKKKSYDWVKSVLPAFLFLFVSLFAAKPFSVFAFSQALAQERVELKYTLEALGQTSRLWPRKQDWNPDNMARVPEFSVLGRLRPDVSLKIDDSLRVVARPRVVAQWQQRKEAFPSENGEKKKDVTEFQSRWQEVFGTLTANENVNFTYGLQNFQWGSAESFSPSNPLYPLPEFDKGLYAEQQGLEMARLNLSVEQWGSLVLLGAKHETGNVLLAKGEVSWNSGSDSVALILSAGDNRKLTIGETVSWNASDALLLYLDAAHGRNFAQLSQIQKILKKENENFGKNLRTQAVGGMRLGFSDGSEARLEALWNEVGLTKTKLNEALGSTKGQNAPPLLALGNRQQALVASQNFLAQWALLTSARIVELPLDNKTTVSGRLTYFPQDASYIALLNAEYAWNEDTTVFLSALTSDPRSSTFAANLATHGGTVGLKKMW
jgi:tryptophan synthase alpha chain